MEKHVKEYKIYQNYLEAVVKETGEFQSLGEIFNRYESLVESRITLAQHQDQHLDALEVTRTEMVNFNIPEIYLYFIWVISWEIYSQIFFFRRNIFFCLFTSKIIDTYFFFNVILENFEI